jgi:hypothetical protein
MTRLRSTTSRDLGHLLRASPGIGRALGLLTEAAMRGPSSLGEADRAAIAQALAPDGGEGAGEASGTLAPLVRLARKVAKHPPKIDDSDIEAVFDAGWDDAAVVHAIVIAGLAGLLDRLVIALDLAPMPREDLVSTLIRLASEGYGAAELLSRRD